MKRKYSCFTLKELRDMTMYEIHATQGQGGGLVARKSTLQRALRYVELRVGEASFGIKYPSGRWHKWRACS